MRSEKSSIGVMLLLAWVGVLPGCGSFVESDNQIARVTVDATGGALHLDAFSLTIPPHAVSRVVTLSVRHAGIEAPIGHAYQLDPSDAVFDAAAPATISIAYDPAAYPHPSEILVVTYTGTAWHALAPAGTPEVGVAHGSTTHTGTFGVMQCPGGVCPATGPDASVDH
jgi:hypothetical protein